MAALCRRLANLARRFPFIPLPAFPFTALAAHFGKIRLLVLRSAEH
jgi:hypothetical protein